MRADWLQTTIGEFSPFSYGKALPERTRRPGLFPVISSAGITGTHVEPLVKSSGVVIGRKGTVGKVTFSPGAFWPIDTAFYVADDPKQRDIRFTYYLLQTLGLERMNSDSAVPGLNRDNAHAVRIVVPRSVDEQRRIAQVLASLDSKIELNHRINQTLESIAQAVFRSWFLDFDPVKAKVAAKTEGRDPLRAAMSAVSGKTDAELNALPPEQHAQLAATAALFPGEMMASELGDIPKGWSTSKVGQLLELVYGKALKSTDRVDGAIPVYGSGGVTGFHDQALVNHGSVIVGRKGTVGALYWEDGPFYPIDTTFYVRPLAAPLTYCFYLLQTLGLNTMNTDAAVPGLNRENVYRLEHVLPSAALLNAFDKTVSVLRASIQSHTKTTQILGNLRDTLLPKLLSGELMIQNIESEA